MMRRLDFIAMASAPIVRLLALIVLPSITMGASCGAEQSDLTRRASFDLSCPEAQLRTIDLGGGTQGVQGCGKKATYVEKCDGQPGYIGTSCGWVLNGAR